MTKSKKPNPPLFYQEERTAVFMDGAHVYSVSKVLEAKFDYAAFTAHISEVSVLKGAHFYTCMTPDENGHDNLRKMTDWLSYNGWRVTEKLVETQVDDNGVKKIKGSILPDMIFDLMKSAGKYDHVVLVSGDGNFCNPVRYLQEHGARVTLISTLATPLVSDALRRQVDQFIDLDKVSMDGVMLRSQEAK